MAKFKLKDIELFYIQKNPDNLTVEQLSDKIGCTKETVARIVAEEEAKKEAAAKKEPTHMSKLMGTKIRKNKPVASVMTPAASELSDTVRPRIVGMSEKVKNAIHKPRGEE